MNDLAEVKALLEQCLREITVIDNALHRELESTKNHNIKLYSYEFSSIIHDYADVYEELNTYQNMISRLTNCTNNQPPTSCECGGKCLKRLTRCLKADQYTLITAVNDLKVISVKAKLKTFTVTCVSNISIIKTKTNNIIDKIDQLITTIQGIGDNKCTHVSDHQTR